MSILKKVLLTTGAALAILLVGTSMKQASAAEYPQVAKLKQFAAEANYMSLPGYLRYLVFQDQGVWLSRRECERIVKSQR